MHFNYFKNIFIMEKKPIVVGMGELLWDVLPTEKKAGGAPVNFAYHASQSGAEAYALSAIGNDALGDELMEQLDKNKINGDYISRVDYPTGTVQVELNDGIPSYTIIEGVAWDHIPLTPKSVELLKQASAVCFGTLAQRAEESLNTLQTLLSHMPADSLRFFDINIRQHFYSKELIEQSLRLANVFKINDEELLLIRPMFGLEGTDEEVCRWFMKQFNLRYVILTAGAEYSTIYAEGESSTLPTPKVTVADTVGAGDSFSGSFVASILAGKSLREAHERAVKVAAFVCTQHGAWPTYPKEL